MSSPILIRVPNTSQKPSKEKSLGKKILLAIFILSIISAMASGGLACGKIKPFADMGDVWTGLLFTYSVAAIFISIFIYLYKKSTTAPQTQYHSSAAVDHPSNIGLALQRESGEMRVVYIAKPDASERFIYLPREESC